MNEYTEAEALRALRIVLDTNIFVSSIFWKEGNPRRAVDLALDGKIKVFTSVEILEELKKVPRRDFAWPEDIIHKQIKIIFG